MAINQIVATVTLITQIQSNSIIGFATGFFYVHNDHLFLVTNRHVVIDKKAGLKPDILRLFLHKDPNNISSCEYYDVPLYSKLFKRKWKEHPLKKEVDVVLIKLEKKEIENNYFIRAWSSSTYLPSHYILDPGEDVFIMGYPRGFFDDKNNLPIFRNAMIASTYGVPFQGTPCFLTDANLHPGTSGSPVITKPKSTWVDKDGNTNMVTGNPYYILGIHSGTYSITLGKGKNEPLGLGVTWYIKIVEEIAELFK